ncbi:MAG TPA: M23 family metallopeptidase [Pyrinomonadaceae bacterium]|nr:M23 family metallopeptidase [Pyrinomonadaceae bacterium]
MIVISLILTALFTLTQTRGDAVKVTVKPQRVYIERGTSNQFLHFDFLLENKTKNKITLDSVQIAVFDHANKLVLRKILDRHGLSPGIHTLPNTEIEAEQSIYLFNPFYSVDGSLVFETLRYEFVFSSHAEPSQFRIGVAVAPIHYAAKAKLTLPLRGRVMVVGGHDFYAPHRRIDLTHPIARAVGLKTNSARYGSDLTIINENGDFYRGRGDHLKDWFGYDASVYSPAPGKVITLVDGIPDNTFASGQVVFSKLLSMNTPSGIFGNYVVLDHGHGEFSLFAHLKSGSFNVRQGDFVRRGQAIARIGFSGNTDFVHTHYQLQNGADPATAEGLPSYFNNFRRILGSRSRWVSRGAIDTGDIVEAR